MQSINGMNDPVTGNHPSGATTARDRWMDQEFKQYQQELAQCEQWLDEGRAHLDSLTRQAQAASDRANGVNRAQVTVADNQWKHRYDAVRAERDEYYERLLRISRGEQIANPAAPATIPKVGTDEAPRRNSMEVALAKAREQMPAILASCVDIDFFKLNEEAQKARRKRHSQEQRMAPTAVAA